MTKRAEFTHPRFLSAGSENNTILPEEGDEIYCNGIFRFNVSAVLEWLKQNPLPVIDVPVRIWGPFAYKEDCYVEAADITRPIVIAEIAPDYCDFIPDFRSDDWYARGYVCIDGQHRLEKAVCLGLETLPAVVLRMEQHIQFLYAGYDSYVGYWNSKLKDRTEDALRWQRSSQV